MDSGSNQLKKVRTFHTDMESLRPAAKPPADRMMPVEQKPTVKLPPVLVPAKPITTPPPPKTATKVQTPNPPAASPTPSSPSPILAAVPNSGLAENVRKELGNIASAPIPVANDRISIMDTDSEIIEGTIITDQKRNRFKLFPAMAEAVQGWFQEGKEAIEERAEAKRAATPTVTTLEERKEIVKKAAVTSALAPKDDHKKLTAKLPSDFDTKAAEAKQSVVIKKKDPEAKPSWSHFEGKTVQQPKEAPAPAATVEPPPEKTTIPAIPVPPVKPEVVVPPKPTIEPVKVVAPTPKTEPVAITIKNKPAPPERPRQWRASPPERKRWQIPRAAVYATAILVAVGAAGGGIAATVWFFGQNQGLVATTPPPNVETNQTPGLLSSDRNLHLPLPNTRALLYKNLMDAATPSGGITVLISTVNKDGYEVPAETADVISVLAWKSSPTFVRSVSELTLGTLGTTPFIVARVSSFDTAFGGLLVAEENLSADLTPLFGEIVTDTFDNTAATGTVPRRVFFTDDVVRNHDVRVLRDGLEAERIVYGFVNQNTVIITEDRATFATLAEATR